MCGLRRRARSCRRLDYEEGRYLSRRVSEVRNAQRFQIASTGKRSSAQAGAPYDQTRTYRTGQVLMHQTFGLGEVTAVIEPKKIDVLFADRLRRLIHAH
jgi:hypothetical protein